LLPHKPLPTRADSRISQQGLIAPNPKQRMNPLSRK